MKEKFNDIFETINVLHKKYSSEKYINTISKFNDNHGDLEKMLEKYKVNPKNKKNEVYNEKRKIIKFKSNKQKYVKEQENSKKAKAI